MKRTGFLAIPLLLLAACEMLPPETTGARQHDQAAAPPSEVAAIPQPAPPAPPPPVAQESVDPKRLVGLTREQMTELIGPPKNVSDSPPATVWGYRVDGCSLDVMFYMDLGTRTFRSLAYEVRPDQPVGLAPPECLARIRAARDAH